MRPSYKFRLIELIKKATGYIPNSLYSFILKLKSKHSQSVNLNKVHDCSFEFNIKTEKYIIKHEMHYCYYVFKIKIQVNTFKKQTRNCYFVFKIKTQEG